MRRTILAAFLTVLFAESTFGYLGGFEAGDGYVAVNSHLKTGEPDYDVAKYNAGQYGANVNPAATYSQANPANRLWTKTLGTLMPSSTNSSPAVTYATSHDPANSPPYYVLQPHTGNRAFVVTTNNQDAGNAVWTGPPQAYSYRVDALDLDGMNPALTGNQTLQLSFWSCAQLWGVGEGGGLPAGSIGNTVSFRDSTGAVGLELGYFQPQTTGDVAWTSLGGATPIPIDVHKWHRWDLTLDLAADTASVAFTPELVPATPTSPAVLGPTVQVLATAPLASKMDSLRSLEFTSTAGINNAKFWALDDFDFCITEAPLSDLLQGGRLWSGDKEFSDFSYLGGGDMPAAEDIWVKAITDASGHVGIRFQGAFVDAPGDGPSDALIGYTVTAPPDKLISDVHLGANPLVFGGDGAVTITETFLGTNDNVVLSAYDLAPGGRQLTDWADLVDAAGNLAPVQQLRVQKDVIAWSRDESAIATMSFIDQSFSQIDSDAMPVMAGNADLDADGDADAADLAMWQAEFGLSVAGKDFMAWQRAASSTTTLAQTAPVPEPCSGLLAVLAVVAISVRCRR